VKEEGRVEWVNLVTLHLPPAQLDCEEDAGKPPRYDSPRDVLASA
jgi:hypothetical protein